VESAVQNPVMCFTGSHGKMTSQLAIREGLDCPNCIISE
jgi:hypothetical protein